MKAQFWSFDIIFAIVIFILAIIVLIYVWSSVSSQFALQFGNNPLTIQSQLNDLDTRLLSPGVPSNWNAQISLANTLTWQNISIGLGNSTAGSISNYKLMTLMAMANQNYQYTKSALGISYDYFITITGSSFNITIGLNPQRSNATSIHVIRNPVMINGNQAQMQLLLWSNLTSGVE